MNWDIRLIGRIKKYITFTNPNGQKCRNRKMYPKYLFTKENLQKQFQDNSTTYSPEELKRYKNNLLIELNLLNSSIRYHI